LKLVLMYYYPELLNRRSPFLLQFMLTPWLDPSDSILDLTYYI
jgi:hypothetical protein